MKPSWLTQESLEHDLFSVFFFFFWQNSISKENFYKTYFFLLCTPLYPKSFLNDQLGSGPGPHKKLLGYPGVLFVQSKNCPVKLTYSR